MKSLLLIRVHPENSPFAAPRGLQPAARWVLGCTLSCGFLLLNTATGCNQNSKKEESVTTEEQPRADEKIYDSDYGVRKQDTSEQTKRMLEELDTRLELLPLERELAEVRIKLSFAQKELEYLRQRVDILEKEETTSSWTLWRARWKRDDAESAVEKAGDQVTDAERELQKAQGLSPATEDQSTQSKWW